MRLISTISIAFKAIGVVPTSICTVKRNLYFLSTVQCFKQYFIAHRYITSIKLETSELHIHECDVFLRSEKHSYLFSYFYFFSHFKTATHVVIMHNVILVQRKYNGSLYAFSKKQSDKKIKSVMKAFC